MKTKVIEVTVCGETGTGKSEVLEVIADALNAFYRNGSSVKVCGKVSKGAIDEAKFTRQTAKNKDTIFVLREANVGPDKTVYD